ncbi:S-adenosyl-L-methionine-dependent methyltransferase [Cladochytrium replicatum]|nr:S-adenosyl-L-methionine-dependent methyltransferase [Cladochytrium replicatum]
MGSCWSRQATAVATPETMDRTAAARWSTTDTAAHEGRTFHAERKSPYVLPDDVLEGSRLNLQHHLIREMFGGPNYSGVTKEQLEKGLKVLDVGCGTGIWLAEMRRDFPHGDYFGVDISSTAWAETFKKLSDDNITLVQGNVLERLPFDDNTFDYVHQQAMVLAVPETQWSHVISELYRVLKPGGVLDIMEGDAAFSYYGNPGKLVTNLQRLMSESFKARGINNKIAKEMMRFVLQDGRFYNIVHQEKRSAVGWPEGDLIGSLWADDIRKGMMGLKPFATAALGIPPDQWEPTIEAFMKDSAESKAYLPAIRITACKIGGSLAGST